MLSPSAISRLQHQHETLVELLHGFSEEELRRHVIPGKWSMFEQSAHLAAYQPTFYARLQRIDLENSPSFERYVADNDPHFHECCKKPLNWLLDYLQNQRAALNQYLLALPGQALQRNGIHPKYGTLTVTGWTEFFLLHEAHHLFSIFMLAREMNTNPKQA